jgi:hypothetical protein
LEFQFLDFSTAEFKKKNQIGIFGIKNGIGIPLPMGSQKSEPKIGIPNTGWGGVGATRVFQSMLVSATVTSKLD